MFRKIGFGAAAALTVGVLAVGCSEDGDTIVTGGSALATDNFPGSSVQANNVGDDQRAFSNANFDAATGNFEIYWNTSNGSAIAVYTTTEGTQDQLWAVYRSSGGAWGTPVHIRAVTGDDEVAIAGFKVLWLNTAHLTGTNDVNARGRDGDAIILFATTDEAPAVPAGTTTGVAFQNPVNRLYGTYFDVSASNGGVAAGVAHGFTVVATEVDFRHVRNNGAADAADVGVLDFGFVSDSLHCTHQFDGNTDRVDSGDPTNYVYLTFLKEPTNGDVAGGVTGARYFAIQFNLNATNNAIPQQSAATAGLVPLPAGVDTATNVEAANGPFVVHNGHMFYTMSNLEDAGGPAGGDTALLAGAFNATTQAGFEISSARTDQTAGAQPADIAFLPSPRNIYGSDHRGLSSTYVIFEETGFSANQANGSRAHNRDLMLSRLDIATTGATTVGAPIEIDGLTGVIDTTNTDADGVTVRTGTLGAVTADSAVTAINRTAEYILVLFRQDNADTDDVADGTAQTAGSATDGQRVVNDVLRGLIIQTRFDAADARTLANSVSPVFEAGGTTSDLDVDFATLSVLRHRDVTGVELQGGLAQGQAKSQSGENCDVGCVFQANNRRMSWAFTQGEPVNANDAADQDLNRLSLNGLIAQLSTDPATAPAAQTPTGVILIDEVDQGLESGTGYSTVFDHVAVIDAGDKSVVTGTTNPAPEAGRVLVLFNSVPETGGDNPASSGTAGSVNNVRLFVSEQATNNTSLSVDKALVSSSPTARIDRQFLSLQGGEQFPVNEDVTNAPHHAPAGAHLYWLEAENFPGSHPRLMTRAYNAADTDSTDAVQQVLANRFEPPLTSSAVANVTKEPFAIDNPFGSAITQVQTGKSGSTVGVYFREAGHKYFQQIGSLDPATGYYTANGAPAPQLVDNEADFNNTINSSRVIFPPECNDLPHSTAVWTKSDTGGSVNRLFVRSHN